MPELPEVETIKRDLEKEVVNKKIKTVEVTGARTIRRHDDKSEFIEKLEGKKILEVSRKGKYLVLLLDSKETLVAHLGMSGQIVKVKGTKEPIAKHTHVVITFTQGGQLRFIDPRTFGEMFVSPPGELENQVEELAHLGFDPIDDVMSWVEFGRELQARQMRLKPLLMDQSFIAGIGNIYADEILFNAGLRFDRASEELTTQEIRRLYRAMLETLQEAIKHRGSTISDEQYRDLFGKSGAFQSQHNVYDREGQACPRCRTKVSRVKTSGRSTFFCEGCQV